MLPRINPTNTESWNKLKQHATVMQSVHMRELFQDDPRRFEKFSLKFEDLLFDFSKNILTEETIGLLLQLAEECRLNEARKVMFSGSAINETENRAVLHTALRNYSGLAVFTGG